MTIWFEFSVVNTFLRHVIDDVTAT